MKALCTKTDNAQTRQKQSTDRGSRWKRIVLIARFWTLISKLKSETCGFPFIQLLMIKITFYIYLKVLKIFYVLKLNFRISFCPCDLEGSKGNELKFLYWVQNSISIFRNNYLYTLESLERYWFRILNWIYTAKVVNNIQIYLAELLKNHY